MNAMISFMASFFVGLPIFVLSGTQNDHWIMAVGPATVQYAVEAEIMDERERTYYLVRRQELELDLRLIRARIKALEDAPPMCFEALLPDSIAISSMIQDNRRYAVHIDNVIHTHPKSAQAKAAKGENDWLYQVLDSAKNVKAQYYYVYLRRLSLKRIADMIGEDAFYKSQLPPPYPTWRCHASH